MSKSTVALACALGIAVMLPVSADTTRVKLAADSGLWEVTTHPKISGSFTIPEEQLQKMSPEQRARIEAAVQAAMGHAKEEHVMRECMTPEKLAQGFDLGNEGDSCKTTVVHNTSTELEVRRECNAENDARTTTEHYRMSGRRHISGTVDAAMSQNGKPLTMHTTIEGKWLGSDCGGVKDMQVVK
ncbi:MAG TPA: DUF3617 domain-containing protein [Steroidobacteraceae bacterium]|nr:DUF3617 domain-containing protein [Steroidobacteraceae bacterium]